MLKKIQGEIHKIVTPDGVLWREEEEAHYFANLTRQTGRSGEELFALNEFTHYPDESNAVYTIGLFGITRSPQDFDLERAKTAIKNLDLVSLIQILSCLPEIPVKYVRETKDFAWRWTKRYLRSYTISKIEVAMYNTLTSNGANPLPASMTSAQVASVRAAVLSLLSLNEPLPPNIPIMLQSAAQRYLQHRVNFFHGRVQNTDFFAPRVTNIFFRLHLARDKSERKARRYYSNYLQSIIDFLSTQSILSLRTHIGKRGYLLDEAIIIYHQTSDQTLREEKIYQIILYLLKKGAIPTALGMQYLHKYPSLLLIVLDLTVMQSPVREELRAVLYSCLTIINNTLANEALLPHNLAVMLLFPHNLAVMLLRQREINYMTFCLLQTSIQDEQLFTIFADLKSRTSYSRAYGIIETESYLYCSIKCIQEKYGFNIQPAAASTAVKQSPNWMSSIFMDPPESSIEMEQLQVTNRR